MLLYWPGHRTFGTMLRHSWLKSYPQNWRGGAFLMLLVLQRLCGRGYFQSLGGLLLDIGEWFLRPTDLILQRLNKRLLPASMPLLWYWWR